MIEAKNNGFMQCENMAVSFNKVFVGCNNYKVYLIYLPLDIQASDDGYNIFERRLKANIIKAIYSYPNIANSAILELCDKMKDSTNSIETLQDILRDIPMDKQINSQSEIHAKEQELNNIALEEKSGVFNRLFKSYLYK